MAITTSMRPAKSPTMWQTAPTRLKISDNTDPSGHACSEGTIALSQVSHSDWGRDETQLA